MKKYSYLPGALLVMAGVIRALLAAQWDALALGLAAAGTAVMLGSLAWNWRDVKAWFADPRGVFVVSSSIAFLVLVGILILCNLLAWFEPVSADLTAAGRNTVTRGTKAFLGQLTRDVQLRQFGRTEDPKVDQLLASFAGAGRRVLVSFVDAEKAPQEARNFAVIRNGTVIVSAGEKFRKVELPTEASLVTAILQVLSDARPKVCFVTGHGEHGLGDASTAGLSRLAALLEGSNFTLERLLLQGDVPVSCAAVIIAGPKQEFTAEESTRLSRYAGLGGRIAILVDPAPSPSLADWLRPWGITTTTGTVIDTSGAGQTVGGGPETPLAFNYGDHPVTRGFELATLYDGARPLDIGPAEVGRPVILARTSGKSYERNAGDAVGAPFDAKRNRSGPLVLAVATSVTVPRGSQGPARVSDEARIVVFGDSDFVANGLLSRQGNRDLALRTISWLVGEEEAQIVNVGERQNRRTDLTERTRMWMYILNLGVLPLIPLFAGIVVFLRSRR
jgi:ABC-type uncharacterized transport system involved in gliding motility auxiliary subunit